MQMLAGCWPTFFDAQHVGAACCVQRKPYQQCWPTMLARFAASITHRDVVREASKGGCKPRQHVGQHAGQHSRQHVGAVCYTIIF